MKYLRHMKSIEKYKHKLVIGGLAACLVASLSFDLRYHRKKEDLPDIWGYELWGEYLTLDTIYPYRQPGGEVWFTEERFRELKGPHSVVIKFFEGKQACSACEDKKMFRNWVREYKDYVHCSPSEESKDKYCVKDSMKVRLSNGDTIEKLYYGMDISGYTRKCWYDDIEHYVYLRMDAMGRSLGKFSVILVRDEAEKLLDKAEPDYVDYDCDNQGYIYKQLYTVFGDVLALRDGGFILYSASEIIRFDSDFHTQYGRNVNIRTRNGEVLKHKVYVIAYEVIEDIYNKTRENDPPEKLVQGVHDKLITYLKGIDIEEEGQNRV